MLFRSREAVRPPPLHAVFQPIVTLGSGEILGYEALIRGPAGSMHASPDALFRMAQETGTTVGLEMTAARTALASWTALDLPGKLFLNFSPLTLRHLLDHRGRAMSALLGLDGAQAAGARIAPSRVVIEVTEQTAVGDAASFAHVVAVLTELGVQYALDDFGTGHANLDRLAELTPQFVKIGRAHV